VWGPRLGISAWRILPDCLLGSWASTCLVPQAVLGGGHRLALHRLAAKISHVGADVDGLVCHLHQPIDYG
jgi:hypothetical protein